MGGFSATTVFDLRQRLARYRTAASESSGRPPARSIRDHQSHGNILISIDDSPDHWCMFGDTPPGWPLDTGCWNFDRGH